MDNTEINAAWTEGPCSMSKQAEDFASRFNGNARIIVSCLYDSFMAGLTEKSYQIPDGIDSIKDDLVKTRTLKQCQNYYELGKERAAEMAHNKYDAKFEVDDRYNIGLKNTKDPENATVIFLDKKGCQVSFPQSLDDMANWEGGSLVLDGGHGISVPSTSMRVVKNITRKYLGYDDTSDEDDIRDAIARATQQHEEGFISDDEYESQLDFLI